MLMLPPPRYSIRPPEAQRLAARKTFAPPDTHRERLRWQLMLLVSQKQTQKKYVAWLRKDHSIDPEYLAAEEAFLQRLGDRVQEALDALR